MTRTISSLFLVIALLALDFQGGANAVSLRQTIRDAQSKVVKIFGAGGLRQLEAYQTGILISPEGHVLTALSYVIDTDDLAVILHDGRKWPAELVGSDPVTELALLKLPAEGAPLPFFDLNSDATHASVSPGQRVLALSNLYGIATGDEQVSVLQGVVTAVAPLRARRGAYQSNFRDKVYILDAYSNNPGAAGGALTDWQGRLLGILGKELKSEVTGTWLNYALPTASLVSTVDDLRTGRLASARAQLPPLEESHTAEELGIALIPNVLSRTPPYIDSVRRDSPADLAGLRPDDLVVFVEGYPVDSHSSVVTQLRQSERASPVTISVLRDGALREFSLSNISTPDQAKTNDSEPTDSTEVERP